MRQTAAKMLLIISAHSRKLYGPLDNDRLGALKKNKELHWEDQSWIWGSRDACFELRLNLQINSFNSIIIKSVYCSRFNCSRIKNSSMIPQITQLPAFPSLNVLISN